MVTANHIKTSLRFGIMCREVTFASWQALAIRMLMVRGCIPALLIMDDNPELSLKGWAKLVHYPYRNLFYRLYTRYGPRPVSRRLTSMEDELSHVPALRCKTSRSGYSEFFGEEDIKQIRSHKLDFILRFGFHIIRGDILTVAHYGVWSFHHGDEKHFRGGPPGFWEIFRRIPVTGAILQRLTERLDAGIVLRKGYFKTIRHSWSGNTDQLFFQTAHWPAQVAVDIMNDVNLTWQMPPSNTQAHVYKNPGNLPMILFIMRVMAARLRFHLNILFKAEKWNVGIIPAPVHSFLEDPALYNPVWLPSPGRHRYAADPFAMVDRNKLLICFELFDYCQAKGHIAMVTVDGHMDRISPPATVLEQAGHLAYPFLFSENDTWYCIPESAENRTVDLYQWDESSGKFICLQTLINDMDAVDATLFRYNGYWWLFFTMKDLSDTHLYAWFSSGMTGPFTSHLNNPIKTDVRSARPAGTPFIHNGHLFRPAQDCSRTYGGSIILQKILKLSPLEFEEVSEMTIEPYKNTSFSKGLHTLSVAGNFTIVDGKKYNFDSYHFLRQLKWKLRKLVSKQV